MVYNTIHMIQVIQINRTNNRGNKKKETKRGGGEKRRKMNESISIPCVYKKRNFGSHIYQHQDTT